MKRLIAGLTGLVVLLTLPLALANPLIPGYMNELCFTGGSWVLEMEPHQQNLDGWSISSREGTAAFKQGIRGFSGMLVTPDSVIPPLAINPAGDSVTVRDAHNFAQRLVFGTGPGCDVQAPRPGWSICFKQFFYLDTIPTLGAPNSNVGGMARIAGYVRDSASGVRISGAQIFDLNNEYGAWATSGDSGEFVIPVYAHNLRLVILRTGYRTIDVPFSLVPGQNVSTVISLGILNSVPERGSLPDFALFQNYPNPFNPSTTIRFSLPRAGQVTLGVFDCLGREVAELVHGTRTPGAFEVSWDGKTDGGGALGSGIYLARLRLTGAEGQRPSEEVIKLLLLH